MFVELNAANAAGLADPLQELGYQYVEAADAPAAISVLETGRRIDLLMTDVGLPGISVAQVNNGYEARLPNEWVGNNPLTDYSLIQEAAEWEKVGIPYRVVYTDD